MTTEDTPVPRAASPGTSETSTGAFVRRGHLASAPRNGGGLAREPSGRRVPEPAAREPARPRRPPRGGRCPTSPAVTCGSASEVCVGP